MQREVPQQLMVLLADAPVLGENVVAGAPQLEELPEAEAPVQVPEDQQGPPQEGIVQIGAIEQELILQAQEPVQLLEGPQLEEVPEAKAPVQEPEDQ